MEIDGPPRTGIRGRHLARGRLIRHARYFILQLAESHLTPTLFRQILGRIERLAWRPTVIEKAGHGGRGKRSALGGSISGPDGRRGQTFGRWAVSLPGAAGTARVTHS